jgi:hypothetical protein
MRNFTPRPKPEKQPKKGKVALKRTPLKRSQTRIKKITQKKAKEIVASKAYYLVAIELNRKKNKGKCICEECGEEILNPTGSNVSHIIADGTNKALYLDLKNHFILCKKDETKWTNGSGKDGRTSMRIYEQSQEIKMELLSNHYSKK